MPDQLPEFESLVATHSRELFAYLWRVLQSNQDAEDCLQETFLRAYRAYPRLTHSQHLRAWLYRIATNTARTYLRHNRPTAELHDELASRGDSPAEAVERRLENNEIRAAVLALPEKQRAALILTRFQGLTYPEAAAALNATEESVRANVYQATRKLRAQFSPQEQEHV